MSYEMGEAMNNYFYFQMERKNIEVEEIIIDKHLKTETSIKEGKS